MKVLFVSSGNKKGNISPIVYNQGESLKQNGIEVDYFTINQKGLLGYVSHILPLSKTINSKDYDVIHAHYSLCGFLVTIASPYFSNIVVSLMGTFKKGTLKYGFVRIFAKWRWKAIIVKSQRMKDQIGLSEAPIIPNGVQIDKFILSQTREDIRLELGFLDSQKIIIFVSNPQRPEKNFMLCKESVDCISDKDVKLITVFNKTQEEVVKYMVAADVLMLSSFSEGSPNVIKEAMAAGCPIVCTNVGDVEYLLQDVKGAYIMNTFSSNEGAELLKKALNFKNRTNGLEKLKILEITANEVANKIINLYN